MASEILPKAVRAGLSAFHSFGALLKKNLSAVAAPEVKWLPYAFGLRGVIPYGFTIEHLPCKSPHGGAHGTVDLSMCI